MNVLTKIILLVLAIIVFVGIFYAVTVIPDSDNDPLACFMAALLAVIGTSTMACVTLFRHWLEDCLYNWMMILGGLTATGGIFAMGIHFKTSVIACFATWIISIAIYIYKRKE